MWSGGVVEWWSDGVMEWWSGGVMEWWSGTPFSIKKLPNYSLHKTPWRNRWFARQRNQHIITANLINPDHGIPAESAGTFVASKVSSAFDGSLFCHSNQVGRRSSFERNREFMRHEVWRSAEPFCYLFLEPRQIVSTPNQKGKHRR